jgi:nitroimidazol reductase NimA-like FMN-containing flavoprotein (pyridoxamine 5'-phosphate oxidase superfamily)
MRRKDKEITDTAEIIKIIAGEKVCRLAMSLDGEPYVIPLNFGYTFDAGQLVLYFHGAKEGKKLDILKSNPKACFEIDCAHKLLAPLSGDAFKYSFAFKSVIGFGAIEFIPDENIAEKKAALGIFMRCQTGSLTPFDFPDDRMNSVAVYKLNVTAFSGKQKIA